MKKNTFSILFLMFLSQFYLESCSSKTDSSPNTATALTNDSTQIIDKNLGMILFFADNVTQIRKDSVINKLKSLNANFINSRNNSNLILVKFKSNVAAMTLDSKTGIFVNNVSSIGYKIDSVSLDRCLYTCNVCTPDNTDFTQQVAMIGCLSNINISRFHIIEGVGFNQQPCMSSFTDEVLLRGEKGSVKACPNNCCCCPNQLVRTFLYSKPVSNNKLDLFNYLDAIYWAKNRKINVLINQFSYVQTNDVKILLTKALGDIKSSNLKILSIDDSQIKDINGLIKASQDLIFSENINSLSTAKKTFKK